MQWKDKKGICGMSLILKIICFAITMIFLVAALGLWGALLGDKLGNEKTAEERRKWQDGQKIDQSTGLDTSNKGSRK
jgi:hypothetical protein